RPAPAQGATSDSLAADWVRFARVTETTGLTLPLAPVGHTPRQDEPASFEPAPRPPASATFPGPRQDRPAEPPALIDPDKPEAAEVETPPPEPAGLLSAAPALALNALESALDALAEHAPAAERSSLPCWLGLCGWGMGAALAWLAIRRRTQDEIALTQERP